MGKWKPEDYAQVLRERYNIEQKVDLYKLSKEIGLQIEEVNAVGFEGALVRIPNKPSGIIALKYDVREPTRKRFTIAHEIGHYILPGHGITDSTCKSLYIESSYKESPKNEIEANQFASELLLPSKQILEIINRDLVSVSTIKRISATYETSLLASSLKAIALTKENCALVFSREGKVKRYIPSCNFPFYIRMGELAFETIASDLISNPTIREKEGSVPVSCWISSREVGRGAELWEDSIFLPYYKTVISILTITSH